MNSESNTALDVTNVVSPVMTRGKSKVPLPQWEWDNACDIKYWMIKLAGFIPEVGAILSTMLEVCWPSKKENVWQQILHEVENMIETSKLTIIQGVLRGFINEMEGKVTHVQFMLETHPGSREAHDAYMSLARYLIGMEEHFCSFDDRTNLQIMPMYTASLMLQVMYWSIGVHKSQEMGLTAREVEEMQDIIDRLVDRSSAYCHALYDTEYDEIINTSDAYDITNDLLSVRGHCLMHGIEVLEIVEQIKARGSKENIILKTLSYSEVFDRVTPKTKLQALTEDDNMVAPLKPAWLGNNYAQIRSLVGYIVRIGGAPRVGGLGITFTDGNTYQLGTITREYRNLELNGSVITLIETWGSGAIDEALFTLSDGRTFSFGQRYSYNYRRFEAPGHYITGLYLASDEPSLRGQAAGIMASYHLRNDPATPSTPVSSVPRPLQSLPRRVAVSVSAHGEGRTRD